MTVSPDAPAGMPADALRPRRKSPTQIPWRDIACRLAEGAKPAAIAAGLGLQEDRIWRHLRQSLRFRFYLRQAIERQRMLAGLQLAALGQSALLTRGLNPENLDGDLLRLLNEAAGEPVSSGNLAKQVEQLGETGQRPPNMAFRARLAAERKRMDAEFEAARRAVATIAAESARSAAKAGEAPRSATNASEAPGSAAKPREAQAGQPEAVPAPRPPAPQRPSAPEPPIRPIVDLEGPDLARLRAAGLLSPGGTGGSG